jgi:hypothetical protein
MFSDLVVEESNRDCSKHQSAHASYRRLSIGCDGQDRATFVSVSCLSVSDVVNSLSDGWGI